VPSPGIEPGPPAFQTGALPATPKGHVVPPPRVELGAFPAHRDALGPPPAGGGLAVALRGKWVGASISAGLFRWEPDSARTRRASKGRSHAFLAASRRTPPHTGRVRRPLHLRGPDGIRTRRLRHAEPALHLVSFRPLSCGAAWGVQESNLRAVINLFGFRQDPLSDDGFEPSYALAPLDGFGGGRGGICARCRVPGVLPPPHVRVSTSC
jgi:hypothetical protein